MGIWITSRIVQPQSQTDPRRGCPPFFLPPYLLTLVQYTQGKRRDHFAVFSVFLLMPHLETRKPFLNTLEPSRRRTSYLGSASASPWPPLPRRCHMAVRTSNEMKNRSMLKKDEVPQTLEHILSKIMVTTLATAGSSNPPQQPVATPVSPWVAPFPTHLSEQLAQMLSPVARSYSSHKPT